MRRSIPPATTPTSTISVSFRPVVGLTSGLVMLRITATIAASTPATATAAMITVSALTPSSREVRKSSAAARICRPIEVRLSRSASPPRETRLAPIARNVDQRMFSEPIVTAWFSCASVPTGSPRPPRWRYVYWSSAAFWSRYATAKVATSIVDASAVRRGRNASRSSTSEAATATSTAIAMLAASGQLSVKASA